MDEEGFNGLSLWSRWPRSGCSPRSPRPPSTPRRRDRAEGRHVSQPRPEAGLRSRWCLKPPRVDKIVERSVVPNFAAWIMLSRDELRYHPDLRRPCGSRVVVDMLIRSSSCARERRRARGRCEGFGTIVRPCHQSSLCTARPAPVSLAAYALTLPVPSRGRACLSAMLSMVCASASFVSAILRRLALASAHRIDAARMRNSSALIR